MTHFFQPDEFVRGGVNWYSQCHPRLLVLLDVFRMLTGPCIISPHPKAIGRREGTDNGKSGFDAHNIDKHGKVMGIDVFPTLHPKAYNLEGTPVEDLNVDVIADEWIYTASSIGIGAVGLYPQWTYKGESRPGLHLDIRPDAVPGSPVMWGFVDGVFVDINEALESLSS